MAPRTASSTRLAFLLDARPRSDPARRRSTGTPYTSRSRVPRVVHHFDTTLQRPRFPPLERPAVRSPIEPNRRRGSDVSHLRCDRSDRLHGDRRCALAAAAPAKQTGTTLSGAGSTFVAPLVSQWIPAIGQAYGYELQYSPIGSGGGVAADHRTAPSTSARATRRLRADQFTACKGCVQIPWALSAHVGHLQRRRRQEPAAHGRPDAREDLHRRDHGVERPGDQEAEQGRHAAEPEDRDRPSLRQLRHDATTSPTISRA